MAREYEASNARLPLPTRSANNGRDRGSRKSTTNFTSPPARPAVVIFSMVDYPQRRWEMGMGEGACESDERKYHDIFGVSRNDCLDPCVEWHNAQLRPEYTNRD
jgi:hypothetical protein